MQGARDTSTLHEKSVGNLRVVTSQPLLLLPHTFLML